MTIHLVTYRPLNSRPAGREAIKKHHLPPYVDGGCRREPDLQSAFPSISAVCRGANFAPRLKEGDTVVYITFLNHKEDQWRLTDILKVQERFESHQEAATWY